MLNASQFGRVLQMGTHTFSVTFLHFILSRQLVTVKEFELWWLFVGKPIRYVTTVLQYKWQVGLSSRIVGLPMEQGLYFSMLGLVFSFTCYLIIPITFVFHIAPSLLNYGDNSLAIMNKTNMYVTLYHISSNGLCFMFSCGVQCLISSVLLSSPLH